MVATFTAFAKCTFGGNSILITTVLKTPQEDKINIENLSKWDDFRDGIFNRSTATPQEREQLLRECSIVFDRLMDNCILPAFEEARLEDQTLVPSNFLKAQKYHELVLKKLLHLKDSKLDEFKRIFFEGLQISQPNEESLIYLELLQLRFKQSKSTKAKIKQDARALSFKNRQAEAIAINAKSLFSNKNKVAARLTTYLLDELDFSPRQEEFWGKEILKILKRHF